ncbi:hypothetical protein PIB30_117526 [Stylosanthes scabra]|uniref:Reverse transcriptase zinc-binding domain-containing protein n=1 Tax=Stylosanthes scabra TaxID=79078 RepID=A0ABU6TEQ2_9FABA|nr:hypothetical protein [Stylosanthes scabra]
MSHDGLPTMERLHSRLSHVSPICTRCSLLPESAFHCIFECPVSAAVWSKLGQKFTPSSLSAESPWKWMNEVITRVQSSPDSKRRLLTFGLTAWKIWLPRNLFIFEGKSLLPEEILAHAGSLSLEIDKIANPLCTSSSS